jgi:tetratricopeptide (TPR) repeat protein
VQTRWRAVITTNDYPQEAADAELADLGAALKKLKSPPAEIVRICEAHRVQRERLQKYFTAYRDWQESEVCAWSERDISQRNKPVGAAPKLPAIVLVPGLPEEFADYFEGACEWRNPAETNKSRARAAWDRLLERPAAERKFKSTWAAYMLGKSWEEEDAAKATNYFQQVRELAQRGFADSLGLATASLGWEARVHLHQGDFQRAIALYLEQLAAGDHSAIESLRETAARALSEHDALPELASDERAQKVLTAYLISFGGGEVPHEAEDYFVRWLSAVEAAGVLDVESAEKFALAAYRGGTFDLAKRWIKRAPDAPLIQWLQVKLLLRDGKIAQAAALLAKVSHSFPLEVSNTNAAASMAANLFVRFSGTRQEPHSVGVQVLGELGVLHLNRRQYAESLDALLRAGFWGDAAYVAERVMTLDELKVYVNEHWPVPKPGTNALTGGDAELASAKVGENLRYLLARRLTRELRGAEAREYYPVQWRPKFDELVATLAEGWDETRYSAQRARALFAAAGIARTNGMELLGTEVAPDWFLHGGNFEYGVTAESRTNEHHQIVPASKDELHRASKHKADPEVRFHYRYQAAFLAWEAAKLMPDNSDETAFVLWQAGEWLKQRDPITADGFYKTLVRRCRQTEIGAEADRIRWFPRLDTNGRVVARETKPAMEPPLPTSPDEPVPDAEVTMEPIPEVIL